jgi:hypothetical protein
MSKATELFETYREVQSAFEDVELSEESLIKLALSLFIDANKSAPKQWTGKNPAPAGGNIGGAGNDGDTRTVVGKLGDKRKESATSKEGKPYTKFFYIVDGKEYNTISKAIAEQLSSAVLGQSKVELKLQKNGKFENLVSAKVIQSEKQEPEFLEEDAPF